MYICIIEDSQTMRRIYQKFFEESNLYELDFSADVESAKKNIEKQIPVNKSSKQPKFDLFLIDYYLPDGNGIDICQWLRKIEIYIDTPIIMITSEASDDLLANAFQAGVTDFLRKPFSGTEFHARIKNLLNLQLKRLQLEEREKALIRSNGQLKMALEILAQLNMTDPLTGIFNRGNFDLQLIKEWDRMKETNSHLSLIMIDIDYFKKYNDFYGHQKGDACLIKICQTISDAIQDPRIIFARYGGEEFSVILPQTDLKTAVAFAEKIRAQIESLKIEHKNSANFNYVTLSLGVTSATIDKLELPEKIIELADKALYDSKSNGRNKVSYINL